MTATAVEGRADEIARRVESFVRDVIVPYERDGRRDSHGPTDAMVLEMKDKARAAGVLTPHILPDGSHLTQRETATVLKKSGLSILGPLAVNTAAPDEGNMYLIGKVGTPEQKEHFLSQLVEGHARSAFFMTEPASEGGAGSDPSMLKTEAKLDGNHWVINGRKAFITGADGAKVAIVMAKTDAGDGKLAATMFLVDLPDRGDPHRARARHDRQLDARRPLDHRARQSARTRRSDPGRAAQGLRICAGAAQPRTAVALHALAGRRYPRERDRDGLCLHAPGVRQAADRS